MALTYAHSLQLGTPVISFDLPVANPDVDDRAGNRRSLQDYTGASVLVVVFNCNHCPYAKHVEPALIEAAREYQGRGVQFVLINPNDASKYEEDSFEGMVERARAKQYPFPYLHDETQEIAHAYDAVCTPDVYAYRNEEGEFLLGYHGRVDGTRPGNGRSTGDELRRALDDLLTGGAVSFPQHPSMGCSIKWKSGSEPS